LGRGMGGRIEDAFAASKAKGEAAFITFVTAGYPTAQGKRARTNLGLSLSLFLVRSLFAVVCKTAVNSHTCLFHPFLPLYSFHCPSDRYARHSLGHAGGRSRPH
jgi:hypothetical protein